jgi:hypothetical protein
MLVSAIVVVLRIGSCLLIELSTIDVAESSTPSSNFCRPACGDANLIAILQLGSVPVKSIVNALDCDCSLRDKNWAKEGDYDSDDDLE